MTLNVLRLEAGCALFGSCSQCKSNAIIILKMYKQKKGTPNRTEIM